MDGIGESTIVQLGERRGSLRTPIPDGKRKHGLGAMVLGFARGRGQEHVRVNDAGLLPVISSVIMSFMFCFVVTGT